MSGIRIPNFAEIFTSIPPVISKYPAALWGLARASFGQDADARLDPLINETQLLSWADLPGLSLRFRRRLFDAAKARSRYDVMARFLDAGTFPDLFSDMCALIAAGAPAPVFVCFVRAKPKHAPAAITTLLLDLPRFLTSPALHELVLLLPLFLEVAGEFPPTVDRGQAALVAFYLLAHTRPEFRGFGRRLLLSGFFESIENLVRKSLSDDALFVAFALAVRADEPLGKAVKNAAEKPPDMPGALLLFYAAGAIPPPKMIDGVVAAALGSVVPRQHKAMLRWLKVARIDGDTKVAIVERLVPRMSPDKFPEAVALLLGLIGDQVVVTVGYCRLLEALVTQVKAEQPCLARIPNILATIIADTLCEGAPVAGLIDAHAASAAAVMGRVFPYVIKSIADGRIVRQMSGFFRVLDRLPLEIACLTCAPLLSAVERERPECLVECLDALPLTTEVAVLVGAVCHARFNPSAPRDPKALMLRFVAESACCGTYKDSAIERLCREEVWTALLARAQTVFQSDRSRPHRLAGACLRAFAELYAVLTDASFLIGVWPSLIGVASLVEFDSPADTQATFGPFFCPATVASTLSAFLNNVAVLRVVLTHFPRKKSAWLALLSASQAANFLLLWVIVAAVRDGDAFFAGVVAQCCFRGVGFLGTPGAVLLLATVVSADAHSGPLLEELCPFGQIPTNVRSLGAAADSDAILPFLTLTRVPAQFASFRACVDRANIDAAVLIQHIAFACLQEHPCLPRLFAFFFGQTSQLSRAVAHFALKSSSKEVARIAVRSAGDDACLIVDAVTRGVLPPTDLEQFAKCKCPPEEAFWIAGACHRRTRASPTIDTVRTAVAFGDEDIIEIVARAVPAKIPPEVVAPAVFLNLPQTCALLPMIEGLPAEAFAPVELSPGLPTSSDTFVQGLLDLVR
jgi:hypothetical protein